MGRILAIDYGNKRVGLAVTDPLCMIASPLETIHSQDLVKYVLAYHQREPLRAVGGGVHVQAALSGAGPAGGAGRYEAGAVLFGGRRVATGSDGERRARQAAAGSSPGGARGGWMA